MTIISCSQPTSELAHLAKHFLSANCVLGAIPVQGTKDRPDGCEEEAMGGVWEDAPGRRNNNSRCKGPGQDQA